MPDICNNFAVLAVPEDTITSFAREHVVAHAPSWSLT